MPKLTKLSPLMVAVQMKGPMLMVADGHVIITDLEGKALAKLPVKKVTLVENTDSQSLICGLQKQEAVGRGKAAIYKMMTGDGKELWRGTVGTKDANMLVRTTEFIPGVMVDCEEFVHTQPYESKE